MKIKSAEIIGLNGLDNHIKLDFNDDLNIITGRNGSGKTNILKLIWYVISGNIFHAIQEINFDEIIIKTTEYTVKISKLSRNSCSLKLVIGEKEVIALDEWILDEDDEDNLQFMLSQLRNVSDNQELHQENPNTLISRRGASLFLPTFRRVEGGIRAKVKNARINMMSSRRLEQSLFELSEIMTNRNHLFVSSLGTIDVERFLRDKNAELVEMVTNLQDETNLIVSNKLKELQKYTDTNQIQTELENIHSIMDKSEQDRLEIMRPLDVARKYILDILKISGIKIGNLTFGDTVQTINSSLLSAGEKQMLSFLAYNAFYQDTIFIIDEPELSLHVDWQRILFPTLLRQNSSNQFIVATHSPFIYAKYPDKELTWVDDRGDCDGE